jgi:hypothetical protein
LGDEGGPGGDEFDVLSWECDGEDGGGEGAQGAEEEGELHGGNWVVV